jgi:hypothetical protein
MQRVVAKWRSDVDDAIGKLAAEYSNVGVASTDAGAKYVRSDALARTRGV